MLTACESEWSAGQREVNRAIFVMEQQYEARRYQLRYIQDLKMGLEKGEDVFTSSNPHEIGEIYCPIW